MDANCVHSSRRRQYDIKQSVMQRYSTYRDVCMTEYADRTINFA